MTTLASSLSGVRIRGKAVDPDHAWTTEVTEPATGEALCTLAGGAEPEARAALEAADGAFDEWSQQPSGRRAAVLRRIAADLRDPETTSELATLVTRETGKRIAEARAEVGLSAAFFEWFADVIGGSAEQAWSVTPGLRHSVLARPLGLVAVLSPWNFPVSIPARKIAPALAAGCTVLFKPSEVAPASALRFAELVEAHVPAGAVNTVFGEPSTISELWLADPRVRGLSFTGSTRVGRLLAASTAPRFTRCVFELGGNAPFVVLDDADLDRAVELLMIAKYRNNGQSCIAANQVWVPEADTDEFARRFAAASDGLRLGDPMDEQTTLGPLAMAGDDARIAELVSAAERDGAQCHRSGVQLPERGQFTAPAICVRPRPDSTLVTEEIFGPAVSILGYTEPERVLESVRRNPYGLGGYVVGSPHRAAEFARKLDVGIIGVNTGAPNTPQVPFAGVGDSGLGAEGGYAGLRPFLADQTIAVAE